MDKIQKIREEVENKLEVMQYQVHRKDAYKELKCVLDYIDSLQEEPKFKTGDRIKPVDSSLGSPRTILEVCDGWYVTDQGTLDFEYEDNWKAVGEPVSEDLEEASKNYALNNTPWDDCKDEIQESFKAGSKWQKQQDQSTIELAEDHAYFAGRTKTIDEINEALLSEVLPCFMHGGEADEVVAKLDEVLNQKK